MATAKQQAYERIRNAIFSGSFGPGHQLKEEALAEKLGISRTPVREAIRLLADEGLVDVKPNRRSYVADITETQFEEVFDLLAYLESYSAGLASAHIPSSAIEQLRDLNDAMAKTAAPADNREFLALNSEFHQTIHRYSESHKVHELLTRIIEFPHNLYLKFEQIPDWHNSQSVIEHDLIITALASGDKNFATIQMRAHIESVRHAFRSLWIASNGDNS